MSVALVIGALGLFCGAVYGLLVTTLWILGSVINRLATRALRKEAHELRRD